MITEQEVLSAAKSHVSGRTLRVTEVAGSVANQDFLLQDDQGGFVLKAAPGGEVAAEAWACERVRREGVQAPEVIALETAAGALPTAFMITRMFEGQSLSDPASADDGLTPLIEAGRQLRVVHDITAEGYGLLAESEPQSIADRHRLDATGPHQLWQGFTDQATAALPELQSAGIVSADFAQRISEQLVDHAGDLSFTQPGSLLHGDLKLPHVFASRGNYVGIIDWGDVALGDPLYDLARFSMEGAAPLQQLLSGYELSLQPEHERSFAAYRIIRNVGALLYEYRAGGDWFDAYRTRIDADLPVLSS